MDIRAAAVIGLGTMGAGIAEVLARGGLTVTAIEVDDATLARGLAHLDSSLGRAVDRGKLTAGAKAEILGRVHPASSLAAAATADLVIEAVPERLEIKHQVLAELDRCCRPGAILATNTSSLSVTAIAAPTQHPGRVVGMHFFNPAPVMPLVEVITTVLTDPAVAAAVTGLAGQLGKRPVAVGDRAGFVANALLLPYLNHAVTLLETGYATREDIDTAARAGLGLPMGPLALLDLIGLDVSLSILEILQGELGGSRCRPAPLLRRLASAGLTGRKTGRGFYSYPPGQPVPGTSAQNIGNAKAVAGPVPLTVIGGAAGENTALAELIRAAGWQVVTGPEAAQLVIVAVPDTAGVLTAALACGRPADAVGLHLVGEKLAEVVTTPLSSLAATTAAMELAAALGRDPVRCPDRPGLLAGALLYPHLADAVAMVQDGYARPADIDTAMTAGCGYPRGPLRLLDDRGAGVVLAGLAAMHDCYGDGAFAPPPPLLREYAAAALAFCG